MPRPSVGTLSFLLAILSCKGPAAWRGPLAASADSVFAPAAKVLCQEARIDFGFKGVTLPLRSFELSKADTTLSVLSDAHLEVLIVSRSIGASPARQITVADSMTLVLSAAYGDPQHCAQSDDLGASDTRLWNLPDRQIELRRHMTDRIVLELRATTHLVTWADKRPVARHGV